MPHTILSSFHLLHQFNSDIQWARVELQSLPLATSLGP